MAANLALQQQAGQANFLNIGSAHLAKSSPAQPSQPEATTLEFSFNAPGASLAEVASFLPLQGRLRRRLTPKRPHVHRPPRNGVDYTGAVKDCDFCPRGKSTPQPHPKQATYGVLYPFKLKTVDTLGPFQPQALGGFGYAT